MRKWVIEQQIGHRPSERLVSEQHARCGRQCTRWTCVQQVALAQLVDRRLDELILRTEVAVNAAVVDIGLGGDLAPAHRRRRMLGEQALGGSLELDSRVGHGLRLCLERRSAKHLF